MYIYVYVLFSIMPIMSDISYARACGHVNAIYIFEIAGMKRKSQ